MPPVELRDPLQISPTMRCSSDARAFGPRPWTRRSPEPRTRFGRWCVAGGRCPRRTEGGVSGRRFSPRRQSYLDRGMKERALIVRSIRRVTRRSVAQPTGRKLKRRPTGPACELPLRVLRAHTPLPVVQVAICDECVALGVGVIRPSHGRVDSWIGSVGVSRVQLVLRNVGRQ